MGLLRLVGIAFAGRFVDNRLEQNGRNDEHRNSERLENKRKACNRKMAQAITRDLLKRALSNMAYLTDGPAEIDGLMGITLAGRFVGNHLEQNSNNNEQKNSKRLGSRPGACNRTCVGQAQQPPKSSPNKVREIDGLRQCRQICWQCSRTKSQ